MGRPKLSEEEKKGQVALRLPPSVAAVLEEIAQIWGEKTGKEVKRATVAREMVLIGLNVFMALKHNRIFAEFARENQDSEDQQVRMAEIATITDDLFSQSRYQNIDPVLTEKAIVESLRLVKEALFNGILPAAPPPPSKEPRPRIPVYQKESLKKGGRH